MKIYEQCQIANTFGFDYIFYVAKIVNFVKMQCTDNLFLTFKQIKMQPKLCWVYSFSVI